MCVCICVRMCLHIYTYTSRGKHKPSNLGRKRNKASVPGPTWEMHYQYLLLISINIYQLHALSSSDKVGLWMHLLGLVSGFSQVQVIEHKSSTWQNCRGQFLLFFFLSLPLSVSITRSETVHISISARFRVGLYRSAKSPNNITNKWLTDWLRLIVTRTATGHGHSPGVCGSPQQGWPAQRH